MNKKITILTQKEKKELLTISNWLGLNADEFNRLEKKYIEILNESDGSTLYETIDRLLENIVEELDDKLFEYSDEKDAEKIFNDNLGLELFFLKTGLQELGLPDCEITEALDNLRDKVEEACERLPYEAVLDILHETSIGLLEYYKKYKK